MEPLLNKKQVAEILGVTVKAIDKWVSEGKLPYTKISRKCLRFRTEDLESYIEDKKISAKPESKRKQAKTRLPSPK
jgi:excisionase family DNA binding protein